MAEDQIITQIQGTATPIRGNDIDTDRIVPARYLKEITFDRMGDYLFQDARYGPNGEVLDHPLNDTRYEGSKVFIVGRNFGSGSSREHAPQAIMRHGIDVIVGESFAEIFAGNCTVNGIPVVTASAEYIAQLQDLTERNPDTRYTIDLEGKTISYNGTSIPIDIADGRRNAFLNGTWNGLALLLGNMPKVRETAANLPYSPPHQ